MVLIIHVTILSLSNFNLCLSPLCGFIFVLRNTTKKVWTLELCRCVEPPCGQLNPASPGLYDTLEQIYSDLLDMFPVQQFHMGGDEISLACWNSSQEVTTHFLTTF